MVNGYGMTYRFGAPEDYVLVFSATVKFQYGLGYHLLTDRQQVVVQLICHAIDQLASGGEEQKPGRIYVKQVGSQDDWVLKDVNAPEKGFEVKTSEYINDRYYLYYDNTPVFGITESSEADCCISYLDPKFPAEEWIDELLESALRHAERWGARSRFRPMNKEITISEQDRNFLY